MLGARLTPILHSNLLMATFKYLLETSTCIELLRGNGRVRQKCIEHNPQCCISVITAIELLYGAYNAPERYREQEIAKAKMLIDYYTVIGIDEIPELSAARSSVWKVLVRSLRIST